MSTTAPDIFISYARADEAWVSSLAAELERAGYSVGLDQYFFRSGHGWAVQRSISEALESARCILVVRSQASTMMPRVGEEAGHGKESRMLVVRKDGRQPPFGFKPIKVADLSAWTPGKKSEEFDALLEAIRERVAGSAGVVAPAPKRMPAPIAEPTSTSQAFLSYTRLDDRGHDGGISALRAALELQVQIVTGDDQFEIFQDVDGIAFGEHWPKRLDEVLAASRFLIPVLSPRFFKSEPCRDELRKFLAHERAAGRDDLILPIYLVEAPVLERPHLTAADELAAAIAQRQRWDWRPHAFAPPTEPAVRKAIRELAAAIGRRLEAPQESGSRQTSEGEPKRRSSCLISYDILDIMFSKKLGDDLTKHGFHCNALPWIPNSANSGGSDKPLWIPDSVSAEVNDKPLFDRFVKHMDWIVLVVSSNSMISSLEKRAKVVWVDEMIHGGQKKLVVAVIDGVPEKAIPRELQFYAKDCLVDFTRWAEPAYTLSALGVLLAQLGHSST